MSKLCSKSLREMSVKFKQNTAIVTGATSQIGYFLLPRLLSAGFEVVALSRQFHSFGEGILWKVLDLQKETLQLTQPSVLFHAAPLPLLPDLLARLPIDSNLQRVIAFSSTSIFTKSDSPDIKERFIINELINAESAFISECEKRKILWTLFRPTLIYGCGRDKNVTFIAHFIQRFGFFPLLGHGKGLRQPVHADDLATACIQACQSPATYCKDYNLSGGETLSYRTMIETIFQALGKKPRIIQIPLRIFTMLTTLLRYLPAFSHLNSAMVKRINQDLCFDHSAATQDFAYCPRKFKPTHF